MKVYSVLFLRIPLGQLVASVLLFLVLSPGTLRAQIFKGDTWAEVQKKTTGTITLAYIETPAFAYRDAAGKPTGVCVDIMNRFISYVERTRKVKINVKWVAKNDEFAYFLDGMKTAQGGVFGLGNITITEERKKMMRFSPPFITNVTMILSNSKAPTLADLRQLPQTFSGMTAYTVKGTTNEKRLLEMKQGIYPDMKIQYVTSSVDVLNKIATDARAFSNMDFTYYVEAIKDKKPVKRHQAGDKKAEQFGIVMPLRSDWAPLMEEFFASGASGFRASNEYKQILIKHLGANAVQMLYEVK